MGLPAPPGSISDIWPDWAPETWTAIGTLALALATVALALVTVFAVFAAEPLRQRFGRASLEMSINPTPPDVHMITQLTRVSPERVQENKVLYIRVRVDHTGGRAAKDAELIARRVWRLEGAQRELVTKFLPLPLTWSHSLLARTFVSASQKRSFATVILDTWRSVSPTTVRHTSS
jgi:hypothetical protein